MSEPTQSENPKLFVELSEQEQETIAGGFDLSDLFGFFFFDQSDIDTSATNAVSFSRGDGNISSLSNTNYRSRRTTLAFGIPMSRSGRRGLSFMKRLLRSMASE
jgi:hypothetical protein